MNETGGERGESSASENVTPEPPKPRGRPRKHEPVEGKESWYQRKKRLDAERIAQGLEPEESYYARKKREEKEDREREAAGLPRLVRRNRNDRGNLVSSRRSRNKYRERERERMTSL